MSALTASPRSAEALASDAARWLIEQGRKRVYVYPAGSPLSLSFRFRRALCEALTGCRVPYCHRVADELPAIEGVAIRAGYELIEIDPEEQFAVVEQAA